MFRINIPRARSGPDGRKGSASLVTAQPMERSANPNLLASGRHFGTAGGLWLINKPFVCWGVFAALCRWRLDSLEYFVR